MMSKQGVSRDSLSLATHYLRFIFAENPETNFDTLPLLATGTGFMYESDGHIYLITNGHNVTGVNHTTKQRLSKHAGIPNLIRAGIKVSVVDNPNGFMNSIAVIDLYKNLDLNQPLWYIHPTHGYDVDVVAIPVLERSKVPVHVHLRPINTFDLDEFDPECGEDVFILGYPFNITASHELAIWKRGSIATEPFLEIEKLPKLLVDTATRSGMSGSPVFHQKFFFDRKKNSFGVFRGFLGVYSGRLGAEDEFMAQLGIVWKKVVIEEIINGKVVSNTDFQQIC